MLQRLFPGVLVERLAKRFSKVAPSKPGLYLRAISAGPKKPATAPCEEYVQRPILIAGAASVRARCPRSQITGMEPTRTWVRPPTSCPSISKCAPPLLASDRTAAAGAAHYPARMRGASENRNQQRDACYRRTPECRSKTCLCKARPASQRVPPVIARLPKGHTKPSVSALASDF